MALELLPRIRIQVLTAASMLGTSLLGGCVALNIPSERLHDSADHGGLLGGWTATDASPGSTGAADCSDPLDDALGRDLSGHWLEEPETKPDPVPWPRFHPVPTRPAFAPAPMPGL